METIQHWIKTEKKYEQLRISQTVKEKLNELLKEFEGTLSEVHFMEMLEFVGVKVR